MREGFWPKANGWWRRMVGRVQRASATSTHWDKANRMLWCLTWRVPEAMELAPEDREDLVQTMMVRLQEEKTLCRIAAVDAPAHYLARMMRNELRNGNNRKRAERRAVRANSYAGEHARRDGRPDRIVEWEEECRKVRYVVNHMVKAQDRKLLWLYYKDGLRAWEIGERLGLTELAVLQRLARARLRVRKLLEQ